MKRLLTVLLISLLVASTASAQGIYIKAGIGYALPLGGQTLGADGNPYSGSIAGSITNNANTAFDIKKASFSSGLQGSIAIGYQLKNKYLAFEVAANAAIAPQTYTLHAANVLNPSGAYYTNATITTQGQLPLFLIPSIILQTGGDKLNLYTRFGLALPLYAAVKTQATYTYQTGFESVEHINETTRAGFSAGIAAGAGVSYLLNNNFKVWLEITALDANLYTKDTKITTHDVDGTAMQSAPGASGTTMKYGYNGTYGGQSPAYALPFSNAGFMAGITVSFNKKTKTGNNANQ